MIQSLDPCVVEARHVTRRSIVSRAFEALLLWQERAAERSRLSTMEDSVLRDIGLTRADVDHEVRKPFWQG